MHITKLSGSDFIKTSTGKESINATLEASVLMCQAISAFFKETGKKVQLKIVLHKPMLMLKFFKIGFKPAGGIKTTEQALEYTIMVETLLGKEWLKPDLFRIGASSLLDDLVRNLQKVKN